MRELKSLPQALLSDAENSPDPLHPTTPPPGCVFRQPAANDVIFYFRNDAVEFRTALTSREYRFVFYLLGMLDADDPEVKTSYFKVNVRAFAKLARLDLNSLWTQLKKLTHGLCCKQLYICGNVFPGGRYPGQEVVNWLDGYGIYERDGFLTVKLTPSIVSIYNHTLRHHSPEQRNLIPCGEFFKLHSVYAQRLYTWANNFRAQKLVKVELARLRTILLQSAKPEQLVAYHDFKRKAIDPASQEISEETDLRISYSELKTNRSVQRLVFTIETKTSTHSVNRHTRRHSRASSLQDRVIHPQALPVQQSLALGNSDREPVVALLTQISQVAPLTDGQQQEIFDNAAELRLDFVTAWWNYALEHGKNPAALFCDAMKRKRPLVLPAKPRTTVTPIASVEIDWDWRSHLLWQGMPEADIPKDLTQLEPGLFQRYILPEHRRRRRSKRSDPRAGSNQPAGSQELLTAYV
jgi:plasmid replication initiation protein